MDLNVIYRIPTFYGCFTPLPGIQLASYKLIERVSLAPRIELATVGLIDTF